jgi:transposase
MGTAFNPAKTSPASWDAFSDVDAFVDAVLAELAAMAADGTRPTRSGPKPPLTGAALRKAIMAIWCVAFCGMQWRAIGQLCDISFGTLYTLFARWTRLGLWRRLLNCLVLAWRQACGDKPVPSAVIIDSRSCRSAPTCFGRGFDGGKKIKGSIVEAPRSMIHLAVDTRRAAKLITASRWRSPSRQRMSMTARASSQCCINLPAAASRGPPWVISATGASGCPRGARHHPPTQRRRPWRNLHPRGYSVGR